MSNHLRHCPKHRKPLPCVHCALAKPAQVAQQQQFLCTAEGCDAVYVVPVGGVVSKDFKFICGKHTPQVQAKAKGVKRADIRALLPEVQRWTKDSLPSVPDKISESTGQPIGEAETSIGTQIVGENADADDSAEDVDRNKGRHDEVFAPAQRPSIPAEQATKIPRYLKTVPHPVVPTNNPDAPYGYDENDRPIGMPVGKPYVRPEVSAVTETPTGPCKMMIALMGNGVHSVIVEKLDRIARDQMVQETIIQSLLKQGFELISAASGEENLCGNDPGRKLMRTIMGAIAEYDKQMLVLKLRAARNRKKAQAGRCEGHKRYGHYSGEADILSRIFSLRSTGGNYEGIARTLNAESVKTRSGGKWYPATVRRILQAQ